MMRLGEIILGNIFQFKTMNPGYLESKITVLTVQEKLTIKKEQQVDLKVSVY